MEACKIVEQMKKYTLKIEIEVESDLEIEEVNKACRELLKDKVNELNTAPFVVWNSESLYIPVIDQII